MNITIRYADGNLAEFKNCKPLGANEAGMYVVEGLNGNTYGMFNPIHVAGVLFPGADSTVTIVNAIVTG